MSSTEAGEEVKRQPLDEWFLNLLACPGCDARLPLHINSAQDTLTCSCGRLTFPVRDGLPILLMDEATIVNSDIEPGDVPVEKGKSID